MRSPPHSSAVDEVEQLLKKLNGIDCSEKEAGERESKKPRQSVDTLPKDYEVAVAVQQGNILATAFHPELTDDLRWHRHFLQMVESDQALRLNQGAST
jgi:hypothetical protein